MAEPARKQSQDPEIKPDIKPRFGVVQGGGESTPGRGSLSVVNDSEENPVTPTSNDDVAEQEANPAGGWNNQYDGPPSLRGGGKKKSALITILITLGLAGLGIGFVGLPSMLLPSIQANATATNDSRSTILERRLARMFDQKMNASGGLCSTSLVRCRVNLVPKGFIDALAKRGIAAIGHSHSGGRYLNQNPTHFDIPDGRGGHRRIQASEFTSEYKNNRAFRASVKKAYNMRYLAYTGNFMKKVFFNKFSLRKSGGMAAASSDLTQSNANSQLAERTRSPHGDDSPDAKKSTFRDRVRSLVDRTAKKSRLTGGDPVLMVGMVSCAAINLPQFIAGTYRAIQLAQILVLTHDMVLSPSSMQMAGDIESEKLSAIGHLLTEKVASEEGGTPKSAMDSPVLLSALGINTGKAEASDYIPGREAFSNSLVTSTAALSASTRTACSQILSPQAAVASTAITAAVGASTLGAGAIAIAVAKALGKLAVTFGAIDATVQVAENAGLIDAMADLAYEASEGVVGNYVEGARGEELGDALGVGLTSYFSQASLAGGAAPLTMEQTSGFIAVMDEVENDYREEAIATLSPFDISSPYTFLGSIVSDFALNIKTSSNPATSISSLFGYLLKTPSKLSPTVSALEDRVDAQCGYAGVFNLDEELAINLAGYPCAGIPAEYLGMSVEEVLNIVEGEIDPETGEPLEDSELAMMIADCSEGDLEGVRGCVIEGTDSSQSTYTVCDNEANIQDDGSCSGSLVTRTITVSGLDARKRAAFSIYLFDKQINDILDGSDEA